MIMDEERKGLKHERAKLKTMNFREKREYIWEYYKIHIMVVLFLVFMFGSLINSWFINPPKKEYLQIAWISGYETQEHMDALARHLTEQLVEDPEREEVLITSFTLSDDASYNNMMYQKLVAMVSSGQIDAFITDAEALKDMAAGGYFALLDETLAKLAEWNPTLSGHLTEQIVYADYFPDEDAPGENGAYGLPLMNCALFKTLGFYEQELFLSITVNSNKTDISARALQVLYE